jgi:hypothetical protein
MADPVSSFRTMLSECAAYQELVGAATAADALETIYTMHIDGEDPARPFALVTNGDDETWQQIASGLSIRTGTIAFQIYLNRDTDTYPAEGAQRAALREAKANIFDQLMAEIQKTRLYLREIKGDVFLDKENLADQYFMIGATATWPGVSA